MIEALFQLIGRTHLLLVHLPIGIILITFIYEIFSCLPLKNFSYHRDTAKFLNFGSLFFTIFSVIAGLLLEKFDAYNADLILKHKVLGFITLGCVFTCVVAFTFSSKKENSHFIPYRILLTITVVVLSITGHQGGNLTHGETYFTEPIAKILEGNGEQEQDDFHNAMLVAEMSKAPFIDDIQKQVLSVQVRKALQQKCVQCHSELKNNGNLVLSTKEGINRGGDSGPALADSHENSELFRRITLPRSDIEAMPTKGHPLTENEVELIKLWIDNGAYWSDEPIKVFPEAPVKLAKIDLPKNPSLKNPIDRLVDAYFKENEISWPKVVSDSQYLKRVSLDIIGKYPDRAIIEAFLESSDPNKRENLVDKLLSLNREYTENWLTFWNDHLRNDYTGTGYITNGRSSISNWLYQALLKNKPYNQFVQELISPKEISKGFIEGIQWRGETNSSQTKAMQAAQNVGQVLLGVNIKCASCHDSFVSNTTLKQAYNFANLFSDQPLEIHRCDKPTGNFAKRAFLYPELGSIEGNTKKEVLESLSHILTQPKNGRLYRTVVNRYWKYLFGRGIIYSPDQMDDPPWDSAILDWLSSYLIDNKYDLKKLLKLIVTSNAYQLRSLPYENEKDLASTQYVFKGPTIRKLSVEQFIDLYSQHLEPIYDSYNNRFVPPYHKKARGAWIWKIRNRKLEPKQVFARYEFDFNKRDLKKATLLSGTYANNLHYQIFLNNTLVFDNQGIETLSKEKIDDLLVDGGNIIAIKALNTTQSVESLAFKVSLELIKNDGSKEFHFTDKNWKVSHQVNEKQKWTDLSFKDKNWGKARVQNQILLNPNKKNFTFATSKVDYPVRASLTQVDAFQEMLGRPLREIVATSRESKISLLQALELTNGNILSAKNEHSANALIEKYGGSTEKIMLYLYQSLLLRDPNPEEKRYFEQTFGSTFQSSDLLSDLIWFLILSPEFHFII